MADHGDLQYFFAIIEISHPESGMALCVNVIAGSDSVENSMSIGGVFCGLSLSSGSHCSGELNVPPVAPCISFFA